MTQQGDDTERLSTWDHRAAETGEDLDLVLQASAPDVSAASQERSRALAQLVVASGRAAGSAGSRRRVPRAAAIAGAGALVLGGAGAAAAASGAWVPPWDRQPAAEFSFTLPSGTQCAEHVDSIEMKQGSPRTAQDVENYLAREHLMFHMSQSDIVAAAREITGAGSASIASDGTITETSHAVGPNALSDADYRAAAVPAANRALIAALARAGFDVAGVGGGAACDS